jgi:multicomponent Na+:H+ antiporter subunit A
MIWWLLGAHVAAVVFIVAFGAQLKRGALLVAGIAPAATALYSAVALARDDVVDTEVQWVEGLDLSFAFRVDDFSALMSLLVAGIGALVFIYAYGYFSSSAGLAKFTATLLSFATAMLGLVWADSVWTLFVFWELTSVTSFLLVGHKNVDAAVRAAARRALLITGAGGLSLLAALVVLVDETGTTRLSQMGAVTGTSATVATVLVMIAAATKSAQVPFHVWLPGAMAAPTPVSAYLHSATMVKAGILLLALMSPVLGDADVWTPLGATLGFATMGWGAFGALRHVDAKLILAWGTMSQLGFLVALLSVGSAKATFAAVSIFLAHAVFKAALFMVVGEIDVRAKTRDVRELTGLWRSMPVACGVAVLSAASMAGVPPLLGFPAKEAAVEAGLGLVGTERTLVLGAIIVGSVLTVAYTTRLLLMTFSSVGSAHGATPTEIGRRRPAMAVPGVVLAAVSVGGFVAIGVANNVVRPAAMVVNSKAEVYSLYRWPGLTDAFLISMGIVAAGLIVGAVIARGRIWVPRPLGADAVDAGVNATLSGARWLTARTQHGSLPVYVVTMSAVASLAALPFLWSVEFDHLVWADNGMQAILVAIAIAAAIGSGFIGSRLGAALGLGAVGISVSGLFAVQGAPDVALTQLLVETVVVVGFVIGLGHLRNRFPVAGGAWRGTRIAVSLALGSAVGIGLMASSANPSGEAPVADLFDGSLGDGGGSNVVNVILTDIRALDTFGEVLVLAVVAVGVIALAGVTRREGSA